MTDRNLKLELTWVGKDHRPRLEPRILLEDPSKNYIAATRLSENDQFDNTLIFGDNLLALKTLATDNRFRGRVKSIFIDPPYNTGSAFEHYDDGIEHSLWLGMMRERLELMRDLLKDDGSIWISIDDNEAHYLRVICDEIFGRSNFVADIAWQKVYSDRMDAKSFSFSYDHILCFRKSDKFTVNKLSKDQNSAQFSFYDSKAGRYYRRRSLRKEGSNSLRSDRPNLWYGIQDPDGNPLFPIKPSGIEGCWRWSRAKYDADKDELTEWVKMSDGRWELYVKQYQEDNAVRPPNTWWEFSEVGHNHEAKQEAQLLVPSDPFSTPKPERLIQRIVNLSSQPGDLILDSFAGSGTTGAVAQKMGRRWIMIELRDHIHTHIVPRMQKVISGEDQGGISNAVDWKGGGGFKYYRLAPSLIKYDVRGNPIINPEYNAEMLAEACCKIEGFSNDPSQAVWWQHGRSSERDFLFVTTRYMCYAELQDLSEEVGPERSLLVLAKAYDREGGVFDNLTVRKIPDAVLDLCEWDHDDYSLKVENLPKAEPKLEPVGVTAGTSKGRKPKVSTEPGLFDAGSEA